MLHSVLPFFLRFQGSKDRKVSVAIPLLSPEQHVKGRQMSSVRTV